MRQKENILAKSMRLCLLAAGISAFTACSDDDMPPSAVDNSPWSLEDNMDTSYRPGDNFFMYCNGSWYKDAVIPEEYSQAGIFYECALVVSEQLANLDFPEYDRLMADTRTVDQSTAQSVAILEAELEKVSNIQTKEDAWRQIAQMTKNGYSTLFRFSLLPNQGNMYVTLVPTSDEAPAPRKQGREKKGPDFRWTIDKGLQLGKPAHKPLYEKLLAAAPDWTYSLEYIKKHPKLREDIRSAANTRITSETADMLNVMADELGLAEKGGIIYYADFEEYLDVVASYGVEEWISLMEDILYYHHAFTSTEALDEINALQGSDMTFEDIAYSMKEKQMYYIQSYRYAQQYVDLSRKARYVEMCKEFKEAFRKRLENVDWMSETTRQNALTKLESMGENAGCPDQWVEEALPELNSGILLQDIIDLQASLAQGVLATAGKTYAETGFNYILFEGPDYQLYVDNAFYDPTTNSIFIMSSFLHEPYYSEDNEPYFYAMTGSTVGHEMTHGFDDSGSQFDEVGNYRNWWTVDDKMEFTERCQNLIDCYNMLEIDPDLLPGVYCNGKQTLGENIADLGGMEIGLDAYIAKKESEGFYGEELQKQIRKYYLGWAECWRSKSDPSYMEYLNQYDVHANNKERVNGVVMNSDRWYETFGVQRGDILYLAPDRRGRIW